MASRAADASATEIAIALTPYRSFVRMRSRAEVTDMSGKVTAGARAATHYPPEHRRPLDTGDHAVGTSQLSWFHDPARPRLPRRGRRRHAVPAAGVGGRRARSATPPRALAIG